MKKEQGVPKSRNVTFRLRGISQNKEYNNSPTSLKTPCLVQNSVWHIHKIPLLNPSLSYINPIHNLTHMFKIFFSLCCIYDYAIQVENFSYGTEIVCDTSFDQRSEAPTDMALSELVQRRGKKIYKSRRIFYLVIFSPFTGNFYRLYLYEYKQRNRSYLVTFLI